jgi:hypothetical protein
VVAWSDNSTNMNRAPQLHLIVGVADRVRVGEGFRRALGW